MLFLWVFGDNVEDAMGHFKFLFFYLACAAAGAWLHGAFVPQSDLPLIGASGAVAGIIAAYLLLHPKVRVWVLAFGRIPLRIPAAIPLLLWLGLQVLMLVMAEQSDVSFAARSRRCGGWRTAHPCPSPPRRAAVRPGDRNAALSGTARTYASGSGRSALGPRWHDVSAMAY